MSKKPENPSAFPVVLDDNQENDVYGGMTLRDYFAAKAMEGIMASPSDSGWTKYDDQHEIAKASYDMADAMLEERAKK